ncbi:thiol:disulfide interchange protein DsbA/DsbL [Gallaecimonas pentaromativorans]|uniref:Thiol:disulfide interchange protein n=1 Tax=Gallaecimonas pentaromativorans TaxID=584787 RepID=A0A3N1NTH0_9GAMM|nr:thiol:disulfide interchange protein DsbA/DsbL [Gallaecimonas pentaromativorans]MED5526164.1 thiol:disulfide interchange protein DsbA/DsbL [Pseudomonadota bacterium]ROQ19179.1 thiol:disulfide interchange protein DsbA [Gallaecimonas pentaromativorans]
MKNLLLGLVALCLVPFAFAKDFKEGENYDVIKMAAPTAQPEVTEYFSFLCPHCYRFEPIVHELAAQLPKDVKFTRNHVDFLGRDLGVELSRSYAVMELLGVEDKVAPKMFSAIHEQHVRLTGRDDIRKVFVAAGVPGEDFDSAVNSFSVNGRLAQMERNTQSADITGVPTVVVNGKYKVNMGSVSSKEELFELVDYLTQKKD